MAVEVKVEGFRDLERALDEVSKAAGKGAMRRALKKAGEPLADLARSLAPRRSGTLKKAISVAPALDPSVRGGRKPSTEVRMYVGPSYTLAGGARHGHLVEFGTGPRQTKAGRSTGTMPAQPFMRPAWMQDQRKLLERLQRETWNELEKSIARARRKAERAARTGR